MSNCALCGNKPKTYRFRYIDGEKKGEIIECCIHEYNARMNAEDTSLALVAGQEVEVVEWQKKRAR